jgi:pyruvate kinase
MILMSRKVKIVATLGPSSGEEDILREMILAGLDVARLNFSHGTHADHLAHIKIIRRLSKELKKPITVLQDLQGPKMRVGVLPDEGILLQEGSTISFSSSEKIEHAKGALKPPLIPLDVPSLFESVVKGTHILLDDGKIEVAVEKVDPDVLHCRVLQGGTLTSHKGVNLPGTSLNVSILTDKDIDDLKFGLANSVDCIAISFVRNAEDLAKVKDRIQDISPEQIDTPLIAKLERPEAIQNLDSIMAMANGVMVARGDLGVETSPSDVPIMQKEIIDSANRVGRTVITATQMLESMMYSPRPTRAEASDIANAVFDGTDAVMLSGETATGKFPVECIRMMSKIVSEAEDHNAEWGHTKTYLADNLFDDATAITAATRTLAHDRNVAAIAVFTLTGHTALLMSKTRPRIPVLALTPFEKTYQRMGLYWGIRPFLVPFAHSVEEMIQTVDVEILKGTQIQIGQQVAIVSGLPINAMRKPNFMLLHTVGDKYNRKGSG